MLPDASPVRTDGIFASSHSLISFILLQNTRFHFINHMYVSFTNTSIHSIHAPAQQKSIINLNCSVRTTPVVFHSSPPSPFLCVSVSFPEHSHFFMCLFPEQKHSSHSSNPFPYSFSNVCVSNVQHCCPDMCPITSGLTLVCLREGRDNSVSLHFLQFTAAHIMCLPVHRVLCSLILPISILHHFILDCVCFFIYVCST